MKTPMRFRIVCASCRSMLVQTTMWARYTAHGDVRDAGGDGPLSEAYCPDCSAEVGTDSEPLTAEEQVPVVREWIRRARHGAAAMVDRARAMLGLATASHLVANAAGAPFALVEMGLDDEVPPTMLGLLAECVARDRAHRAAHPEYEHVYPDDVDVGGLGGRGLLEDLEAIWNRALDGECVISASEDLRRLVELDPVRGLDLRAVFATGFWHVAVRRPNRSGSSSDRIKIAEHAHPMFEVACSVVAEQLRTYDATPATEDLGPRPRPLRMTMQRTLLLADLVKDGRVEEPMVGTALHRPWMRVAEYLLERGLATWDSKYTQPGCRTLLPTKLGRELVTGG